jgi:hypothetical protein
VAYHYNVSPQIFPQDFLGGIFGLQICNIQMMNLIKESVGKITVSLMAKYNHICKSG